MIAWLVPLCLAAPVRLVIGLDHPDLRRADATPQVEALRRAAGGTLVRRLSSSLVLDVADAARARAQLRAAGVAWVEEDRPFPVRPRFAPDDPRYPEQWTLHPTATTAAVAAINVEAAWDLTRGLVGEEPVIVAVLDDGFDLAHPDLAESVVPGRDFSATPEDDDPSPGPRDVHGTHTAGVIAAIGDNGVGLAGACPACALLPVRLLGGGGPADLYTTGSSVAAALEWAVDQGAAVINNSWGPPDGNRYDPWHPVESWPLPQAVAAALAWASVHGRQGLGTVVTWSAGNGNELCSYDGFAADPRVIAVGSVNALGVRAHYSDYGPPLALVAPSSDTRELPAVVTTDLAGPVGESVGDYFDDFGGTSASAALVAGVAALVIAHRPELTAAQVSEALFDGAYPIDPLRGQYVDGRSQLYGYGRVDAAGALAAAESYAGPFTHWLEVCANGLDDDGDGVVDDPDRCAPCVPDEPREICDGVDNTCDGFADEYFVCQQADRPVCAPCQSSTQCALGLRCRAASAFPGSWCFAECVGGACPPGFACDGEVCVLTPSADALDCFDLLRCGQAERCDRLDNDCNGVTDDVAPASLERLVADRTCDGPGVCAGAPAFCRDGAWTCARDERWQADETRCDGLDNDCDGETDEHPVCAARDRRLHTPTSCRSLTGSGTFLLLVATRKGVRNLFVRLRRRMRRRSSSAATAGHGKGS